MIINRLQQLLDELKLNQSEAAKRLGIRQQNLSLILNKKRPFGTNMQRRVIAEFGVSKDWLLTGQGEMFQQKLEDNISPVKSNAIKVPLFSIEAVAGFVNGGEQTEFVEDEILWYGAQKEDFAISVVGDSMSPIIPNGSIALLRPYAVFDVEDLCFGKPHVIIQNDGRAMLKVIKYDRNKSGHIILESFNPDFPPKSIPASSIRHYYLVVSCQINF